MQIVCKSKYSPSVDGPKDKQQKVTQWSKKIYVLPQIHSLTTLRFSDIYIQ
jgi:hypothetical protein